MCVWCFCFFFGCNLHLVMLLSPLFQRQFCQDNDNEVNDDKGDNDDDTHVMWLMVTMFVVVVSDDNDDE